LLLQLLKFLKFSKARSTNVSSAQFRFIELHIAGFSHSMRDNITQYWHDMLSGCTAYQATLSFPAFQSCSASTAKFIPVQRFQLTTLLTALN
jgi:hypothetical protein